jgi:hypothetical protein
MSDDIQILETDNSRYSSYEIPSDGILNLGARNKSAITRFAMIVSSIIRKKTQMPDNLWIQHIAMRVTGPDKQDFSIIMTGRKGKGKSYSSLRIAQKIAEAIAKITRNNPEDYFTLENCCLLEDTEGINKIIKSAGTNQVILIDDAGVAVGSRDFATTKNKNFNALLSTCRTKRWVIILNVPAKSHLDKQIRELVDCWARVIIKMHDRGFNILKINSVEINENNANKPYGKRYAFSGEERDAKGNAVKKKIGLYAVCSPEKHVADEYDIRRDAAAQRIIDAAITGDEEPIKNKRDQVREELLEKHKDTILKMIGNGESAASVARACKISDAMLRRLRGELNC